MSTSKYEPQATLHGYVTGFGLSLFFTILAFTLVELHKMSNKVLFGTVVVLALAQFIVQVYFFLHLGQDRKPRWKSMAFLFMLMVVVILVFGSLWIMSNLNYRMTPQQINTYMNNQDGF